MENIRSYKELRVYKAAMEAAMKIFELSKRFPPEERYSLTDQVMIFNYEDWVIRPSKAKRG
jgi:hypothetical protein